MPEIEREKVKAMLAEVPEDQHEALLQRLKERGYSVKPLAQADIVQSRGSLPPEVRAKLGENTMQGESMASKLQTLAGKTIPGVGHVAEALRETIPGFIAEKGGELGVPPAVAAGVATPISVAGEMIPKTVGEGLLTAAGAGVGYGAGAKAVKALPPLAARPQNVQKAVAAAEAAGVLPTMAQVTQSPNLAMGEEIMSRIPIIGGRITGMRRAQEQAYQAFRSDAVLKSGKKLPDSELGAGIQSKVGGFLDEATAKREKELAKLHDAILKKSGPEATREAIGRQLDEIRVAKTEVARLKKDKLYEKVSESLTDDMNQVSDNNMRSFADSTFSQFERLSKETLPAEARNLLRDISNGPAGKVIENAPRPAVGMDMLGAMAPEQAEKLATRKAYTFGEMQTYRHTLNSLIDQEKAKAFPGTTVAGRIYKGLKNALDEDIVSFSKGLPGNLKKKFDTATAFYRDVYKEDYANQAIESFARVAKKNPEEAYEFIKGLDVSDLRRVKKIVGDGFKPFNRKFTDELVTGPGGEILTGDQITRNMAKYGRETLGELLDKKQLKELDKYVETRELPKFIESAIEKKLRSVMFQSGGIYRAPEDVVRKIVDGDVATLRAVKKIVGKNGMEPIKRKIFEEILGEAHNPNLLAAQAQEKSALSMAKALKSYDENFLKEIASNKELAEIQKIDDLKALLQSQKLLMANAPQTAPALLGPAAAGSSAVLFFFNKAKGAMVAVTADMLSRLYVSESGRKLLIKGLDPKFKKDAAVAAAIASRLGHAAVKNNLDDK